MPQTTSVILAFDGDSNDVDEWSNIPYLLGSGFEELGLTVHRINLTQPIWIKRIWRYTIGPWHKLRNWDTSFDFYRSSLNHWLTTRRLNSAVRRFGSTGCILVNLSISSSPTTREIPVVLLSDWSYDYYITDMLGRDPYSSESNTIKRDNAAMARANLVVLLFPESAERLRSQIPSGNFRFLGHVINSHPLAPPPPSIPTASNPHEPSRLLFVGRPRYQQGLRLLLESISLIPSTIPVHLDVVGIGPTDISFEFPNSISVSLHGYLSKANTSQRGLYYRLLNEADLIINASKRWGGFSATVEAMYRKAAVLTTPYSEFQALFGRFSIPFGSYLYDLSPEYISNAIIDHVTDPVALADKQTEAHLAVESMSWQAFTKRLLSELDQ